MTEILKRVTVINEKAKHELGITRDEYALCSYVLYRSADPRQKMRGYCCDIKEDIAFFVGISRQGLYKMIDKMERLNLLCVDPVTSFINCTALFIDIENECKQSLHSKDSKRVNKVYTDCKLSLHGTVNLVAPNKEDKEEERKSNIKEAEPQKPPSSLAIFTLEESTEAAVEWCKENAATIKNWMDTAKVQKTPDELKTEIMAFFSNYRAGTSDVHEIRTKPVRYFSDKFPGWLIKGKSFQKNNTPGAARTYQKPAGPITPIIRTPQTEKQPF